MKDHDERDLVTTIIERARELGPRERVDYLRRACGSDETLLSHVMHPLGDAASNPGFWDEVAAGERSDETPSQSLEGQLLGHYRILRKLGTGGMGDVYLAERADQEYQQQVAIKVVRGGAFSPQVQTRLRTE